MAEVRVPILDENGEIPSRFWPAIVRNVSGAVEQAVTTALPPLVTAAVTAAVAPITGQVTTLTANVGTLTTNLATLTTSVAGKIAASIFTAKGQLLAASAAGTPVAVPAGVDGQLLTADASAAGGVAFKNAPDGGVHPFLTLGC